MMKKQQDLKLDTESIDAIIGGVDIDDEVLQSVSGGCTTRCFFTTPDASCNGGNPCP